MIAHNIRSSHNVGSLLRTADGLGVELVYLTGYTPYPYSDPDPRLPHIAEKVDKQIRKTALGAETSQTWKQADNIEITVNNLRQDGFVICALEQTAGAVSLSTYHAPDRVAIIVGNEVSGIDNATLALCDICIAIPMRGKKESFNVAQAAAMCMYHIAHTG